MALSPDCLFCKIIQRQLPAKIAYETEHVLAFHDINPQAPVHLLIIPKEHLARVSELSAADAHWMAELTLAANHLAQQHQVAETGYRLVMNCNRGAGQTVFHLHLHLLAGRQMTWPPG